MKSGIKSRAGIVTELVKHFWQRGWWWMTPMLLFLLLFSFLVIFAQSSAIAPFIYTLF